MEAIADPRLVARERGCARATGCSSLKQRFLPPYWVAHLHSARGREKLSVSGLYDRCSLADLTLQLELVKCAAGTIRYKGAGIV